MRHFPILAWAGRLHQPSVVDAGVWDPRRIEYQEETIVDIILSMALTDRKVTTLAEIDAAVKQSKSTQGWRKLWVPESLAYEVARRVTQAAGK